MALILGKVFVKRNCRICRAYYREVGKIVVKRNHSVMGCGQN